MSKEEKFKSIIELTLERIVDDTNDVLKDEKSEFNDGQKLAFNKAFTAFLDAMLVVDADPKEFGLDFDPDKFL